MHLGALQLHPIYIAGRGNYRNNMGKDRKTDLSVEKAGLEKI